MLPYPADGKGGDVNILNIAFYQFTSLSDLPRLRIEFRARCAALRLKGSILLSHEGMNGFLAGPESSVREFQRFLGGRTEFAGLTFKESWSDAIPFNRMLVKLKREIISMGEPQIEPAKKTAARITARDLKQRLDAGDPLLLVDTRNDYEIKLGTFEDAVDLGVKHFREFPAKLREVSAEWKNREVVMFCTGGIRCEKATALAQDLGFEKVYQLDGGILKYFEDCGGAHYRGDCFVFDQRVALDPNLKGTHAIQCFNCRSPLTFEEQQSPLYVYEVSCPNCHSMQSA